MPNIEDFSAGNIAIRPSETGVESAAAAGRRMGVYGGQVAASYERIGQDVKQGIQVAEQYVEHREINTYAKSAADFRVAHDQKWSDFITGRDIPEDAPNRQDLIDQRINNPNIGKQWRDANLEPDLQTFGQSALTPGGQRFVNEFANNYREHMAAHIAADQSSMAGAVVHANKEKMVDSLATAVFNSPGTLDSIVKQYDDSVKGIVGSHPTLKPQDATKITTESAQADKTKLVQAAAQGAIFKGGDWKAIAKAYPEYVKPAENAQLDRAAQIQEKQSKYYATALQNEQKRAANEQLNDTINASSTKNVRFNADGTSDIKPQFVDDVNNLTNPVDANGKPRMVPPNAWKVKQEIGNWIEHQQKNPKGGLTDAATVAELDSRLFSADNPTTSMDLRNAQLAGKLSNHDFSMREGLIKERDAAPIKDPQFKYATDQVKAKLEGGNPIAKLHNAGKFAEFMQSFLPEYLKQSREGKPTSALLNLSDPKSLISQTLASHAPNLGQSIQLNGGVGAPLKTGPIAPPLPKPVPQASM